MCFCLKGPQKKNYTLQQIYGQNKPNRPRLFTNKHDWTMIQWGTASGVSSPVADDFISVILNHVYHQNTLVHLLMSEFRLKCQFTVGFGVSELLLTCCVCLSATPQTSRCTGTGWPSHTVCRCPGGTTRSVWRTGRSRRKSSDHMASCCVVHLCFSWGQTHRSVFSWSLMLYLDQEEEESKHVLWTATQVDAQNFR